MSILYRKLLNLTLKCFDDLISHYNLNVTKKITTYGYYLILEDNDNFISINYCTHPHDYPFFFDVRYCKKHFFDKSHVLYETDTKEITPLWRFDKNINIKICGSLEEDIKTVKECCEKSIEMFEYFAKMSNDEYLTTKKC